MKTTFLRTLCFITTASLITCSKNEEREKFNFCDNLRITQLKTINADQESLTLQWEVSGITTSFDVEVFSGNTSLRKEKAINKSITIDKLQPNTQYRVTVTPKCTNEGVNGAKREIVSSTNNGCNQEAPKNFKNFKDKTGNLIAEWDNQGAGVVYNIKLIDKKSKGALIEINSLNSNKLNVPLLAGIDAELIVTPVCKIGEFLAVSKNSINIPFKTESIFSTEPINLQSLNCSNVNCSFLDTIAKQPTNGGAIGTTGFRYTIYSFPFDEIKDNSCEIHYYQIISLSGVDNIPLVFSKKNGKVQINNNVQNSKCSNLKLVKDPLSDSYNFENKPIHPVIRVYTNKLEVEVETFTGGVVKKLIIH